eukprot:m.49891 g.49891  ORF g.49891 m.49891 type:complete len:170 (-) comp15089_c1_seq1:179-688(-)
MRVDSRGGGDARIKLKLGDLLSATEKYIVQQCNARSDRAKGLSEVLFKKFPHADIYSNRSHREPGDISVHGPPGRRVINMIGQVGPGKPKVSGADSADARLAYFKECLEKIAKLDDLGSVAFPFMIGCGLGGGDWTLYLEALNAFAARVAPVPVFMYKLDDQAGRKRKN